MRKEIFLLLMCMMILVTSCAIKEELTFDELIEKGEKYLVEMKYDEAIACLLDAIEIEPKNEKVYVILADTYSELGDSTKEQAVLELGFAMVPESHVIESQLLETMIENQDAKAVIRYITDVRRTKELELNAFQKAFNEITYLDNTEFLEELTKLLYEDDENSTLALSLELWVLSNKDYENEDELFDTVYKLLLERDLKIPSLAAGDEYYIGEYDENGNRSGFGICFYGQGTKINSKLYIGYWEDDVRAGQGVAYSEVSYYMQGNWANDLPNGDMKTRYSQDMTATGNYLDGVGDGEMIHYYDDGSVQIHNIIINGERFLRDFDSTKLYSCGHTYHWDIEYIEEEN